MDPTTAYPQLTITLTRRQRDAELDNVIREAGLDPAADAWQVTFEQVQRLFGLYGQPIDDGTALAPFIDFGLAVDTQISRGGDRKSDEFKGQICTLKTVDEAAAELCVSPRSVKSARKVMDEGTDEDVTRAAV